MGIVFKQSFNNTLILFLGFAIGGINVLFLYTHFLEAEYFGLITFLLSSANMIMPLLVFGMQHTIIKFFSAYQHKEEQDGFLLTAVLLPMLIIIPLSIVGVLFYHQIAEYLARENIIIEKYTYTIFFTSIFMGYFEIFYAWSRVQMRSVLVISSRRSLREYAFHFYYWRFFLIGSMENNLYMPWLSCISFE